MERCKTTLGNRPVDIRIPDGLPRVMVDLARIREVLVHLIENANQYSPAGQPITISAEASGDCVVTSLADRGSGIDDQEQSLIFEKFYRGKDQRYSVEGTGMGLPIAKAIVQAHRGTISLTSQRGQGSVFSLRFRPNAVARLSHDLRHHTCCGRRAANPPRDTNHTSRHTDMPFSKQRTGEEALASIQAPAA